MLGADQVAVRLPGSLLVATVIRVGAVGTGTHKQCQVNPQEFKHEVNVYVYECQVASKNIILHCTYEYMQCKHSQYRYTSMKVIISTHKNTCTCTMHCLLPVRVVKSSEVETPSPKPLVANIVAV